MWIYQFCRLRYRIDKLRIYLWLITIWYTCIEVGLLMELRRNPKYGLMLPYEINDCCSLFKLVDGAFNGDNSEAARPIFASATLRILTWILLPTAKHYLLSLLHLKHFLYQKPANSLIATIWTDTRQQARWISFERSL